MIKIMLLRRCLVMSQNRELITRNSQMGEKERWNEKVRENSQYIDVAVMGDIILKRMRENN